MTLDNPDDNKIRPVVLLLLDGWGIAPANEANLISLVDTSNFDSLNKEYPVATLSPGDKGINCRYSSLGAGQNISDEQETDEGKTLTDILSDKNLKQIKIAETEKFAAATYYFNGKREGKVTGEEHIIVSSGLDYPVKEVVKETIKAIKDNQYNFIMSVISDIDIVANKGDLDKLRERIEVVDESIKKIANEVLEKKGVLIISSATGNAEKVKNIATETLDTDITENNVPLLIIKEDYKNKNIGLADPPDNDLSLLAPVGTLADIAPTILKFMGIRKPESMKGNSLVN